MFLCVFVSYAAKLNLRELARFSCEKQLNNVTIKKSIRILNSVFFCYFNCSRVQF